MKHIINVPIPPAKYADRGIPHLIAEMVKQRALIKHLRTAQIVGAGNLFPEFHNAQNLDMPRLTTSLKISFEY